MSDLYKARRPAYLDIIGMLARRSLILGIFALILGAPALADTSSAWLAKLYSLDGQAFKRSAAKEWQPVEIGTEFVNGDEIRIGDNSRAGLEFIDGYFIRLSSNASMRFQVPAQAGGANVDLEEGKLHLFNRSTAVSPVISTSVVTAAIRGSEVLIDASSKKADISVLEGSVFASNKAGSATLSKGEAASVLAGKAPVKSILVSPADAVQWTISVPADLDPSIYTSNSGKGAPLAKPLAALGRGDLLSALASIGKTTTPAAKVLKAELLLALGQIDQASAVLEPLVSDEKDPSILATSESSLALIKVAAGKNDQALQLAQSALSHAPNRPYSAVALSYVYQSRRDLVKATEVLESALKANPESALLLARLAELEMGQGQLDDASAHAKKAAQNDERSSYVNSVLGFSLLLDGETAAAKQQFELAQSLNGANGLPYLGSALATISDGDLSKADELMQRAVHLEPNQSVYRSYLGKLFFEQRREDKAINEYEQAIKFDPNDPTPWLYRAFARLSKNRPVEALDDVEQSIVRNDNRAVYRSSMLLDQDLAVRGAGLSRIFNELGFSEAARAEAIKSSSRDYTNFSAHHLLADSATEIFAADSSLSERRIADMLAPVNFNLLSTLGSKVSFNDYDALFDRAQDQTIVSYNYDGGQDGHFPSILQSGKHGSIGYGLSFEPGIADGSKHNNFLREDLLTGVMRYQINRNNRLLLDGSGRYQSLRDSNLDEEEAKFDGFKTSIGFVHQSGPSSTFLVESAIDRGFDKSRNRDALRTIDSTVVVDSIPETLADELTLDMKTKEYLTASRTGAQYIFQNSDLTLVAGGQFLHQDANRKEDSALTSDSLGDFAGQDLVLTSQGDEGLNAADEYLYGTWHINSWADLTAGLGRTDVEAQPREVAPFAPDKRSEGRFLPKFGAVINPTNALSIRGAYYQSLRKSSLEDQISLEPTNLAGFSQTFNDLTSTWAKNVGAGVSYKLASKTYIGGEMIHRSLEEPLQAANQEIVTNLDELSQSLNIQISDPFDAQVRQDFSKAYIYQVFTNSLVGSVDYRYSRERVDAGVDSQTILNHRFVNQAKYFLPGGLFVYGRAFWLKQQSNNDAFLSQGSDSAWIFDAGLGYRIPHSRGTLSFEVQNFTDNSFVIDQSPGFEDALYSSRAFLAKATVSFE